MIHRVYTIWDEKVQAYHRPFFSQTHGSAARIISDALVDPSSGYGRHAEDYSLFYIGTFNDETGLIDAAVPLELVVQLHTLKKDEQS